MSAPVTVTLNNGANAGFDPMSYVLAAVILVACAVLAWRRSTSPPAQGGQNRWGSVAISSLTFAASLAMLMFLPSSRGFGFSIAMVLVVTMIGFLMFGIVAFFLVSLIELATWRVRASRSHGWLIAAPCIFALTFILPFVVIGLVIGPGL